MEIALDNSLPEDAYDNMMLIYIQAQDDSYVMIVPNDETLYSLKKKMIASLNNKNVSFEVIDITFKKQYPNSLYDGISLNMRT